MRAKLNERLSSLLGLDLASGAPAAKEQPDNSAATVQIPQDGDDGEQGERQEEEFEFRLFSTSSKTAAPVKVVLAESDDEDADLGDGAFIVPERPTSYYLAKDPTTEQLETYRQMALAGNDILLGARKRAWGLERPWRVVRIGPSGKILAAAAIAAAATGKASEVKTTATLPASSAMADEKEKRKRPGKKRRIATRIKAKAEKEKREAAESQKLTKEEHLKEKKKRLNREKKLKRRAKEREQKLAGKGQDGSQAAASEAAGSGSDDGSDA